MRNCTPNSTLFSLASWNELPPHRSPTFLEPREALGQRADRLLRYRVHQPVGEALLQGGTREQISHEVAQRHRPVVDAVADDRHWPTDVVHAALIELQLLLAAAGLALDWRLAVHTFDVFQLDLQRVARTVQVLQVLRRTETSVGRGILKLPRCSVEESQYIPQFPLDHDSDA